MSALKAAIKQLANEAILITFTAGVLENIVTLFAYNTLLRLCLALDTVLLKEAGIAGACKSEIVCKWTNVTIFVRRAGNIRNTGKILA